MIDQVYFENFKSLKNVSLDLGRLTVLVGPNGCGKSSVLQGIHLLAQTGVARLDEQSNLRLRFRWTFHDQQDPGRIASPGRPTTILFGMRIAGGDALSLRIEVPIPLGENPDNEQYRFTALVEGPAGPLSLTVPHTSSQPQEPLPYLNDPRVTQFGSAVYLHLDANKMARSSVSADVRPRMDADGSQLASAPGPRKRLPRGPRAPSRPRCHERRARLPRRNRSAHRARVRTSSMKIRDYLKWQDDTSLDAFITRIRMTTIASARTFVSTWWAIRFENGLVCCLRLLGSA